MTRKRTNAKATKATVAQAMSQTIENAQVSSTKQKKTYISPSEVKNFQDVENKFALSQYVGEFPKVAEVQERWINKDRRMKFASKNR